MKTVQPERQTEPRTPLSRERVLGAAIELADASGIDSLSMRKLAQKLGVEAMSLYHWFARKEDLLTGMLDIVFSEMELPATGNDWRSDMRTCAISAKDVLLSHPWSAQLLGSPSNASPARFVWMNAVLGRLRGAGFSPNMTHHAYHALDSHIEGFVLWVLPYVQLENEQPDFAQQFLENFPWAELPHLAEHIKEHMEDRTGDTSEFEFGLDLLLDGLDKKRNAG
jgi:AcrR family transcriptional regulator